MTDDELVAIEARLSTSVIGPVYTRQGPGGAPDYADAGSDIRALIGAVRRLRAADGAQPGQVTMRVAVAQVTESMTAPGQWYAYALVPELRLLAACASRAAAVAVALEHARAAGAVLAAARSVWTVWTEEDGDDQHRDARGEEGEEHGPAAGSGR